MDALAARIGYAELDSRLSPRLIYRRIRHGFNLQFVRGLHEDQAMVPDRACVPTEEIRTDIHRPRHLRRGSQRKFRLAVFELQVTRQYRLSFLDDVYGRRPARLAGKHFELNALTGAVHGAFRAQQNLILALARFELTLAGRMVSFAIGSLNFQSRVTRFWLHARHANAALIGGHVLIDIPGGVDHQVGLRGSSVGVRSQNKNLVLEIWDERATLWNRRNQKRRFADGDRFTASFRMTGRVFHRGLNQHASGTVAERPPGKVFRQLNVETIRSVRVRLAVSRRHFKHCDIHRGSLDADFGVIHRLSKKVVGTHRAGDVIAGLVAALLLFALIAELHCHLEFWQHVSFDIERDLRGIRRRLGVAHQRTQVVRAQVYFIGQSKFGGGNSELVGLGRSLEYLVAARILEFESQLVVGRRLMIGTVER